VSSVQVLVNGKQFLLLRRHSPCYSYIQSSSVKVLTVIEKRKTRVPEENHRPAACHWQNLSHNVVSRTPDHERDSKISHWFHITILPYDHDHDSYVTFIEQKGECIIIYFGRSCDEFTEWVWPIKISDGARVTLFNKGLVSCDVNQSFLILLFEWEYVSFMMISCIFCYRRYCMVWRHLASPPLWVSWDIVRLLTIEKTRHHDTNIR
jgi:hypothetical protein